MNSKKLSYIITTFNRLNFLKLLLEEIRQHKKENYELVIVDGDSTDGTKEWLIANAQEYSIDQWISEKDFGEAHGFNKGLLLAQGEYLKILTVDDCFDFKLIDDCIDYLDLNPEIDLIGSNVLNYQVGDESYSLLNFTNQFQHWKLKEQSYFWFMGQGWIFRKSSLPKTGVLNTTFIAVDTEFTLRITSNLKINIAWCTLPIGLRIEHSESNFVTKNKALNEQTNRLFEYYKWKDFGGNPHGIKERFKRLFRLNKEKVQKIRIDISPEFQTFKLHTTPPKDIEDLSVFASKLLTKHNKTSQSNILK